MHTAHKAPGFLHQHSNDPGAKTEHQDRGKLPPCSSSRATVDIPSHPLHLSPSPLRPSFSDFLTLLCLQGRYSSLSSLLPCLTAFFLLLGAAGHVLWLPLFLDGCRGSSLQRYLSRAEHRQRRKSTAKWPEAPRWKGL